MKRSHGIGLSAWLAVTAGWVSPAFAAAPDPQQQHQAQDSGKQQGAAGDVDMPGHMQGGQEMMRQDQQDQQQQRTAQRQISGKVMSAKTVPIRGTNEKSVAVMLKTEKNRRIVADLGPVSQLRQQDVRLQRGENITLTGRPAQLGDREVFFAQKLHADNKTVSVDRRKVVQQQQQQGQDQQHGQGQQQQNP